MSEPEEMKMTKKLSRGGRNLLMMGILAVVIAMTTTGVSLAIYHNSGDIYLDRSRPGYLPDEEEIEQSEALEEYKFERSGKIYAETMDEYLTGVENELKIIDSYQGPFNPEVLSDKYFGLE